MSSDELEYLALASTSPADERLTVLQATFPEVFRQGKIDFDALRRSLGEWFEPGQERFGLSWPGKAECMRVIQEPSIGTLTPMPKESIDWDTTQNVIIEGENLEVLKLLQKAYYGKVKIIYIDPPYNTGKEFIYPDNFREGLTDYLRYSGQVDEEGFKLSANAETDGRYHSKWLSMMYPRLFLARNLLREDGVIFISIDDHEVHNLRMLMNEIFGEENFVAELVWEKTRKNDARLFSVGHDYMLVFARSLEKLRTDATIWREPKPGAAEIVTRYRVLRAEHGANDAAVQQALREWYRSLPDGHPSKKLSRYKWVDARGPWRDRDISWPGGGGPRYEIVHPETGEP
ncbi:MAG: site-specific DNA-methyltransferase, partial [Acidimicrobiia bacterium]